MLHFPNHKAHSIALLLQNRYNPGPIGQAHLAKTHAPVEERLANATAQLEAEGITKIDALEDYRQARADAYNIARKPGSPTYEELHAQRS